MLKALIYKEFLKTKNIIFIFLIMLIMVIFKTYLDAKNAFEYNDGVNVVLFIAQKHVFDFNYLDFICPIFAILLAVYQFYKEVNDAKIRLHLHLPLSYIKLISFLIFSGIVFLGVIFILVTIGYYFILNHFYPPQIFNAVLSKLIPIFLLSLLCYICVMISFLEPKMIRKFVYLIATYFIFNTFMKLNNIAFFISEYANFYIIFIILIYILTSYSVFVMYKKGYIK